MAFTDKEREQWLAEKRRREAAHYHPVPNSEGLPSAKCILCHRRFSTAEGDVFAQFPICDICDGD